VEFGVSALQPVVEERSLATPISGGSFARPGGAVARLDDYPGASACGRRNSKKGDEALGRSRGGFSTKLHVACDARGQAVELRLGPGQEADITRAPELLSDHQPDAVIADKAYDADSFVELVQEREAEVVIPPLSCRKVLRQFSKRKYKQRNLIERFLNRLKHYRRVATRYEKTARNFLAFTQLATTLVSLGVNVNTT